MDFTSFSLLAFLEVVWINIILSGDNAVVIALACRGLPANQRRMGLVMGAGVAVALRIVFTVAVAKLLTTPFIKLAGGCLLIWIAVKLIAEDSEADDGKIAASDRLWHAVRTVAIADMVMSLDNVLAIAAVAKGNTALLVLGLLISIPLIVAGATLIMALLARFPLLVWAGAGLLGWVAGDMLVSDPVVIGWLQSSMPTWVMPDKESPVGFSPTHAVEYTVSAICAAIVLAVGWHLARRSDAEDEKPAG